MEKAILVTVDLEDRCAWKAQDRANELRDLASSGRASVEHEIICRRDRPTPDLFIGKGKFEEIIAISNSKRIDLVIFNNDLTPTQLRNLEKGLEEIRVIDRTQLILDIFSQHAKSMEGKLQVEMAQLQYLLPRLVGRGIQLSRLGGGIGTRGPGEKILEYDRRRIRYRIGKLKIELKDLEKRRQGLRKRRKNAMLTSIAIIGYTNAGKTTLLNTLTNSKKLTADKLFSTLDPVSRVYTLPNKLKVIFHDTVGFLYNLPHHLVESFKATLEEVKMADIIVHVLDASNPRAHELDEAVYNVLKELAAEDKLTINALNKIDLVDNIFHLKQLERDFKNVVPISSLKGEGIGIFIDKISDLLQDFIIEIKMDIPNNRRDKLNLIYEHGKVNHREDKEHSIYIEAVVPVRLKKLL